MDSIVKPIEQALLPIFKSQHGQAKVIKEPKRWHVCGTIRRHNGEVSANSVT